MIQKFFLKVLYVFVVRTRKIWSDELYLKLMFFATMKKRLKITPPLTYNAKLQWLKLNYHNPLYTDLVDKIKVKEWVAEKIGKQYIIPTIATYNNAGDINFDDLPEQFVLKCNHNSGGLCICTDKSKLNYQKVRKDLDDSLKVDFFSLAREWPYKNVERRILAEKYMVDESGYELKDYKFFCFSGVPKYMFIASDRQLSGEETKFDFYDMDFNHLPFTHGHPNSTRPIKKPSSFDEMKRLAAILSEGMPHVRVDFYDINGQIYFGEMTFYHHTGMVPFNPESWDYEFGKNLVLPDKMI